MTVCASIQRKKRRDPNKIKFKTINNHDEFISRITKTLYYGKVPLTERFSLPVSELAAEIYSEVKNGHSLEHLRVDEAAKISRNACVSPCSLVLALLYLERLKSCNREYIEKVAPSELFLVSMMVASKFLHEDGEEDEVFNNEWAVLGGLDVKEMNRLEWEFLDAINWKVYISPETFWERLLEMEKKLALKQGRKRGWFSYTELSQLMEGVELVSLAQTLLTMSAVCLTSYAASVLAMVGSTILINQLPTASELITHTSNIVTPLIPYASPHQPTDLHADLSQHIVFSIQDCPVRNNTFNTYCTKRKLTRGKLTWAEDEINDTFEHFSNADFNSVKWKDEDNWIYTISNLLLTNSPAVMFPIEISAR